MRTPGFTNFQAAQFAQGPFACSTGTMFSPGTSVSGDPFVSASQFIVRPSVDAQATGPFAMVNPAIFLSGRNSAREVYFAKGRKTFGAASAGGGSDGPDGAGGGEGGGPKKTGKILRPVIDLPQVKRGDGIVEITMPEGETIGRIIAVNKVSIDDTKPAMGKARRGLLLLFTAYVREILGADVSLVTARLYTSDGIKNVTVTQGENTVRQSMKALVQLYGRTMGLDKPDVEKTLEQIRKDVSSMQAMLGDSDVTTPLGVASFDEAHSAAVADLTAILAGAVNLRNGADKLRVEAGKARVAVRAALAAGGRADDRAQAEDASNGGTSSIAAVIESARSLEKKIAAMKAVVDSNEELLTGIRAEIGERPTRGELIKLERERASLVSENSTVAEQLAEVRSQMEEFEKELQAKVEELESASTRADELEGAKGEMESQLGVVRERLQKLEADRAEIDELTVRVERAESELEGTGETIASLRGRIVTAVGRLDEGISGPMASLLETLEKGAAIFGADSPIARDAKDFAQVLQGARDMLGEEVSVKPGGTPGMDGAPAAGPEEDDASSAEAAPDAAGKSEVPEPPQLSAEVRRRFSEIFGRTDAAALFLHDEASFQDCAAKVEEVQRGMYERLEAARNSFSEITKYTSHVRPHKNEIQGRIDALRTVPADIDARVAYMEELVSTDAAISSLESLADAWIEASDAYGRYTSKFAFDKEPPDEMDGHIEVAEILGNLRADDVENVNDEIENLTEKLKVFREQVLDLDRRKRARMGHPPRSLSDLLIGVFRPDVGTYAGFIEGLSLKRRELPSTLGALDSYRVLVAAFEFILSSLGEGIAEITDQSENEWMGSFDFVDRVLSVLWNINGKLVDLRRLQREIEDSKVDGISGDEVQGPYAVLNDISLAEGETVETFLPSLQRLQTANDDLSKMISGNQERLTRIVTMREIVEGVMMDDLVNRRRVGFTKAKVLTRTFVDGLTTAQMDARIMTYEQSGRTVTPLMQGQIEGQFEDWRKANKETWIAITGAAAEGKKITKWQEIKNKDAQRYVESALSRTSQATRAGKRGGDQPDMNWSANSPSVRNGHIGDVLDEMTAGLRRKSGKEASSLSEAVNNFKVRVLQPGRNKPFKVRTHSRELQDFAKRYMWLQERPKGGGKGRGRK